MALSTENVICVRMNWRTGALSECIHGMSLHGYERAMHAKYVLETSFSNFSNANLKKAWATWLEHSGLIAERHKNKDLTKAEKRKMLQKKTIDIFRRVYLHDCSKNSSEVQSTCIKFLKEATGGLVHAFKAMNDLVLRDIVVSSIFLMLASGQPVPNFVQGRSPSFFYIIVSGSISMHHQPEVHLAMETCAILKRQPRYIHRAPIGPVEYTICEFESFGEHNLMLEMPLGNTAICNEPTLLLAVTKSAFKTHLSSVFMSLKESHEKCTFLENSITQFKGWGRNRVLRAARFLKRFSCPGNTKIITEGSICNKVYFIELGDCKIMTKDDPFARQQSKRNIIGEHRFERYKVHPRKKLSIDIMYISHGSMWGEASLLWKGLLRSESDARMNASETVDTSSAVLMSRTQHRNICDVITQGFVQGYVIEREDLSSFIDICAGTRFIVDIANLYEERKAFVSKRRDDILAERQHETRRSSSPIPPISPIRLTPMNQPNRLIKMNEKMKSKTIHRQQRQLQVSPVKQSLKKKSILTPANSKALNLTNIQPIKSVKYEFRGSGNSPPLVFATSSFQDQAEMDSYLSNLVSSQSKKNKLNQLTKGLAPKVDLEDKLELTLRRLKGVTRVENDIEKRRKLEFTTPGDRNRDRIRRARNSRTLRTNKQARIMLLESTLLLPTPSLENSNDAISQDNSHNSHHFLGFYDPWDVMADGR